MVGYSAYDWKTVAMSRSIGSTSLTTRPPMLISPELTLSSPAIIASSVDLPQPDGPTSTTNSPGSTSRSMSCNTACAPNRLLSLRMLSEAIYFTAPWVSPRTK